MGEGADVPVTQSGAAPQVDDASQDSGSEATEWRQSGECVWRVADGVLEVRPADGRATGALGDFDWLRYKPLIKSAVFLPGV